jgi:hypothetical protein
MTNDDLPPTPSPNDVPPEPENQGDDDNEHEGTVVEISRVMQLLQNGKIKRGMGRIKWSTNYTTVVQVADDELETLAVYKPRNGERSLWDFPDGTLCQREVAAYVISEA